MAKILSLSSIACLLCLYSSPKISTRIWTQTSFSDVHHYHNLVRGTQRTCNSLKYLLHARFLAGRVTYGHSSSAARKKEEPVLLLIVGREKISDQKLIFAGFLQCNLFASRPVLMLLLSILLFMKICFFF